MGLTPDFTHSVKNDRFWARIACQSLVTKNLLFGRASSCLAADQLWGIRIKSFPRTDQWQRCRLIQSTHPLPWNGQYWCNQTSKQTNNTTLKKKKMTVRGTMVRSEVCNWCYCWGSQHQHQPESISINQSWSASIRIKNINQNHSASIRIDQHQLASININQHHSMTTSLSTKKKIFGYWHIYEEVLNFGYPLHYALWS